LSKVHCDFFKLSAVASYQRKKNFVLPWRHEAKKYIAYTYNKHIITIRYILKNKKGETQKEDVGKGKKE